MRHIVNIGTLSVRLRNAERADGAQLASEVARALAVRARELRTASSLTLTVDGERRAEPSQVAQAIASAVVDAGRQR